MAIDVPAQPEFGEPLPVEAAPEVLAFLARRRSASALSLRGPGPSAGEIETLIRLAARVPDHGKLFPWRFLVLEGEAKAAMAEKLAVMAKNRTDAPKATAALGKFSLPPVAICVVSRIMPGDIPEWEQVLSAGAVCSTLLNAASAMGYGANWITDWYSTDEAAKAVIGVRPGDRVAGIIYIGTPAEAPLERVRPEVGRLISRPEAG